MNNNSQFMGANYSQKAYNIPSRAGNAQEVLLSPRITGHQPNSNFYENPAAMKQFSLSQGPEFALQHQGIGYNNYDTKLQAQSHSGWEPQLMPQGSPHFKPQLRPAVSPNPINWQSQNPKYEYPRYNSTPKLQPVQRLFKRTWPLLKGNVYPAVIDGKPSKIEIRDVWEDNLESEMKLICKVIQKFKYVGIDTEFPGIVTKPAPEAASKNPPYQMLRSNVDIMNIIQLGLCFANESGKLATMADIDPTNTDKAEYKLCWQFHFKFNINEDLFSSSAIELLNKDGINFEALENHGINILDFGELLITSGLVLSPDIHWIAFHGGYDFCYLLKTATNIPLPREKKHFNRLLGMYFPNVVDLKHITKFESCLQNLASKYKVDRVGPNQQAGSDALLILQTYFQVTKKNLHKDKYGVLYGLNI